MGPNEQKCRCGHARGDHARNEGECLEDDCDCIMFVHEVKTFIAREAVRPGRQRVHPMPAVGDRFGPLTVTDVLGRGHKARADLRLRCRCECGHVVEGYEFNLRRYRDAECAHGR